MISFSTRRATGRTSGRIANFKAANKMRKELKMSEVETGFRFCLICDYKFFSEDLKNQKCCNICRREVE